MDGLIAYLIVGLIVGLIARFLMPGPDPIGVLGTVIVGIVGAVVGGYVWEALFGDNRGVAWIGSIIMAMLVLWLYRRFSYGRSTV